MFALWGYSVYIIFNKLENTTTVEKAVLIVSAVLFVFFVIGASMEDEVVPQVPQSKYECLQLGSDRARLDCIQTYRF